MDDKFAPLVPDELAALAKHMKYNPGLYGENVHRLLLSHQLLQASYKVSEDTRAAHLELIKKVSADVKRLEEQNATVSKALSTTLTEYQGWQEGLTEFMLKLGNGEMTDGHHTHNELYEYRLLYNAYAALGLYAAGYTVVRSWKHHDGQDCFGGGWFIVVMYVPGPDDTEVQVTNHYKAEAWDPFHEIPELPVALPWDHHNPVEAAQRLRDGVPLALPTFLNLKHDAGRTAALEEDISWALSELGHEHWQNCDSKAEDCYLCAGYLEMKEKYKDA